MRNVVFIGQAGCKACERMYETVIAPLAKRHPANVSAHYRWDSAVERVSRRGTITRVPLIVVENGGEEEFRYSGGMTLEELEAIVLCEREALTLQDVLDGDVE